MSDANTSSLPLQPAPFLLRVGGPSWTEYWLQLDSWPMNGSSARIEREVRCVSGAGVAAASLSQWLRELEPRNLGVRSAKVEVSLDQGDDPNARFVRREMEAIAEHGGNLSLLPGPSFSSAPYRVYHIAHGASYSMREMHLLQSGDITEPIRICRLGAQQVLASRQVPTTALDEASTQVPPETCVGASTSSHATTDALGEAGSLIVGEAARFLAEVLGLEVDENVVAWAARALARTKPGTLEAIPSWESVMSQALQAR